MNMIKAHEVKALAGRLSDTKGHLCACVNNVERQQRVEITRRTLAEARTVKSRSAQANAELAQGIKWAEQALAESADIIHRAAVKAHLS